MKIVITCLCLMILVQPAVAQTARDKAEKRLAALLAPGGAESPTTTPTQAAHWLGSKAMLEIVEEQSTR